MKPPQKPLRVSRGKRQQAQQKTFREHIKAARETKLPVIVHSRNAGLNMAMLVQCEMATPIIAEIGTDEQKRRFRGPSDA